MRPSGYVLVFIVVVEVFDRSANRHSRPSVWQSLRDQSQRPDRQVGCDAFGLVADGFSCRGHRRGERGGYIGKVDAVQGRAGGAVVHVDSRVHG